MLRVLVIKAVLNVCAYLPLPLNHALGGFLGWLLYCGPSKTKRVTTINIRRCFPELSSQQQGHLIKRSLIEMGKTMTEASALWLRREAKIMGWVKQVSGEEHVRTAMRQGRGMILAVPHLGAWEMVGLYASKHYAITSLYRPPKIMALDELVRKGREHLGAKLVPTDMKGVRALYHALDKNEMVGILPDQEPAAGAGVFAPFFGIPAYTMILVSRMAQKNKCPVIFAYAERLPWGRGYHLHFIPVPAALQENGLEASAAILNQMVEQCVRQRPEQYQWSYKRFRLRPEGERGYY